MKRRKIVNKNNLTFIFWLITFKNGNVMKTYLKLFLFITFYSLTFNYIYSQEKEDTVHIQIRLKDGSNLIGNVVGQDSTSIKFKTTGSIIVQIPKEQIVSTQISSIEEYKEEVTWYDPNGSRLFLTPTARPIGNNKSYFAIYELFFPTFSIGIKEFLSVTAGMSILPGATFQIFYISPKLTFLHINNNSSDFYLASGLLYTKPTEKGDNSFSVLYGIGTYGNNLAGLTIGVGYNFSEDRYSKDALFILGGELNISDNFKLISENYIPSSGEDPLVSFGFRVYGSKLSADLGFFKIIGEDFNQGFPFIPWVSFAYNF